MNFLSFSSSSSSSSSMARLSLLLLLLLLLMQQAPTTTAFLNRMTVSPQRIGIMTTTTTTTTTRLHQSFLSNLFQSWSLPGSKVLPGKLILVRSGESLWNEQSLFTGWTDVELTESGTQDTIIAGRLLREYGCKVDIAYTSVLKRAIESTHILLRELKQVYRPVVTTYKLNGRMYGSLEGLSKRTVTQLVGKQASECIRTSFSFRPPAMSPDHPQWHRNESKYAGLPTTAVPLSESMSDVIDRTKRFWQTAILPDIRSGKNVLVVGHVDSLKGIIFQIDNMSALQLQTLDLPNSIPLMYEFDTDPEHRAITKTTATTTAAVTTGGGGAVISNNTTTTTTTTTTSFTGQFLESRTFSELFSNSHKPGTSKQHRPHKYNSPHQPPQPQRPQQQQRHQQQQLEVHSYQQQQQQQDESSEMFVLNESSSELPLPSLQRPPQNSLTPEQDELISQLVYNYTQQWKAREQLLQQQQQQQQQSIIKVNHSTHYGSLSSHNNNNNNGRKIVIIRHGKTEFNKLGLFTGWQDAMLAVEGVAEAAAAGALLRRHGFVFDRVYTSWLTRAIETAWLLLRELDLLWLPIVKTWRLNERMYGALTGLSKKMVAQQYGSALCKRWRHSFDTAPPKLTSFSPHYPGNDDRYVKYVDDLPVSLFETLIRSVANNRLEIHRRFPKTESLKDSMDRTIPYLRDVILPEAIKGQQRVLIATSENAIRGLLMHLCEIPHDQVHLIEIPTGLPLVYDLDLKCIKLLDDGLYAGNPLKRHYFGAKPELLFEPCDDESGDQCFLSDDGQTFKFDPLIPLPAQ